MPAAASIDGYRLSTTVCPVLGIACVILLLNRFLGTQPDVAEPRFISSKIPYIGHMLGLMRYKMRYYTIIRYEMIFQVK